MLSDKENLEEDDAPVLASRDPPTEEDSQWIDDKDLGRRENEVTEPRRLGKLDIDDLAENNDAPAIFETKVKPIATTMPDAACICPRFPENPLELLPPVFASLPEFFVELLFVAGKNE